jgi:hypothetical protein
VDLAKWVDGAYRVASEPTASDVDAATDDDLTSDDATNRLTNTAADAVADATWLAGTARHAPTDSE